MNKLRALVQFIPLTVFVFTFRLTSDWAIAFQMGGLVALVQVVFLAFTRQKPDLILSGVNSFLVVGALAFAAKIEPILMVYSRLQEATLFLAILLVALISTATLRSGFLGVQEIPRRAAIKGSLILISVVAASVFMAAHWSGNLWLAGVLPMIFILVVRKIIRQKFATTLGISPIDS